MSNGEVTNEQIEATWDQHSVMRFPGQDMTNECRLAAALVNERRKLTFAALAEISRARSDSTFKAQDWSPTDWGCALAGEVGEACNFAKKIRRGDAGVTAADVGKELADVVIYADLWAQHLGLDLEELIRNKFNEVSVRHGAPERL